MKKAATQGIASFTQSFEEHDNHHSPLVGHSATLKRVSRSFWWLSIKKANKGAIETCDECQRNKMETIGSYNHCLFHNKYAKT